MKNAAPIVSKIACLISIIGMARAVKYEPLQTGTTQSIHHADRELHELSQGSRKSMKTKSPTASSQPSESPSVHPSSAPSVSPEPSAMPSERPSASPSISTEPSASPTMSSMPSFSPSNYPTSAPSNSPSLLPSESPSSSPSAMPSIHPSSSPSISSEPSTTPSVSSMPSLYPSSQPSSAPSISNAPSISPMPSSSPSSMPSCGSTKRKSVRSPTSRSNKLKSRYQIKGGNRSYSSAKTSKTKNRKCDSSSADERSFDGNGMPRISSPAGNDVAASDDNNSSGGGNRKAGGDARPSNETRESHLFENSRSNRLHYSQTSIISTVCVMFLLFVFFN